MALILLPIIYLIKKRKPLLKSLGLIPKGIKEDSRNTVLLFIALVLVSLILSFSLSLVGLNDLGKVDAAINSIKATIPYFLIYLMVVRVFSEELFFRGFLVEKIGVIGSAAVFALAHVLYGSTAEILGAFVLGGLLAIAYKANKSLIPNILAHMLYNFIILAILI